MQYADYAVWQREWLTEDLMEDQLRYWKQVLGDGRVKPLEIGRPRPTTMEYAGGEMTFSVGEKVVAGIRRINREEGATMYMALAAGFAGLLHRYSGDDQIIIGSPVANRRRPETERMIGCFINTLALKIDLRSNPSYREMVRRARNAALDAYEHQDVPFDRVVEAIRPERAINRTPIFQVWFVLHNTPVEQISVGDLKLRPIFIEANTAQFDLTLSMIDLGDALSGSLIYNRDLFDGELVSQMLDHFKILLEEFASRPDTGLLDVQLIGPETCAAIGTAQMEDSFAF
jgi:non-ribosomal peptide synthetase component F